MVLLDAAAECDTEWGSNKNVEEFVRRNNHGQTKYVRLPASGGVLLVAKEFARAIARP